MSDKTAGRETCVGGQMDREREKWNSREKWHNCTGGGREDGGRMNEFPSPGGVEEEAGRAARGWRWAGEHTHYLIQLTPHARILYITFFLF